jgi:hypothetical protein
MSMLLLHGNGHIAKNHNGYDLMTNQSESPFISPALQPDAMGGFQYMASWDSTTVRAGCLGVEEPARPYKDDITTPS